MGRVWLVMAASCLAAEVKPAVPCGFIVPTCPGFALSVLLASVCVCRGSHLRERKQRTQRTESGSQQHGCRRGAAIQVRG